MVPTMVKKLPVARSGMLGAQGNCRWIYMGNNNWQWVCRNDQGGGNRIIKLPGVMNGAAAPATPKTQNETVNDVVTDPFGTKTESGSFDIMQFISDNALWLGLGAAGLLAIFLFSKKRR